MPAFVLILVALWMPGGILGGLWEGGSADDPPTASVRMAKDVRMEYYDVAGTSWQEIAQELRAKGPGAFFGQTLYQIGYRYTSRQVGARCWVSDATVTLDVKVTLPRWARASRAAVATPYALRRDWDLFRTRLERHEREHVRLAERGAEAVKAFLSEASGECATLDNLVNERVRGIVAEWDERNHGYDVETGHGRAEGAVWPLGGAVARR